MKIGDKIKMRSGEDCVIVEVNSDTFVVDDGYVKYTVPIECVTEEDGTLWLAKNWFNKRIKEYIGTIVRKLN